MYPTPCKRRGNCQEGTVVGIRSGGMSASRAYHSVSGELWRSLYVFIFILPPTTEEANAIARDVCLSVSRLLKNACMDLDDILCVDRCRDIDELINF